MTTITGTILLPNGAPYKKRVKFTPMNTPAAFIVAPTSVFLTKEAIFACDDSGALASCSLEPLIYRVTFDSTELDTIDYFTVPDSAEEQDFAVLASTALGVSGTHITTSALLGVENVAALRAITVHVQDSYHFLLGVNERGDGGAKPWYYQADSVADDDGFFVAKPNDVTGAGRWLAL